MELEGERESIFHKHALEKEDMQQSYNKVQQELEEQLSALTRDRDNSLLMSENDRQQVVINLTKFVIIIFLLCVHSDTITPV